MRVLSALVALFALALSATASASNVTVGGSSVLNLSAGVTSFGQSFTVPAGTEGFLHTLRLNFRPATGQPTFHVSVSAIDGGGLPTGTPLYTSAAIASPATVSVATTVYPNVTLTPGTQYALFADNAASGQMLGNLSNVYSGGREVAFIGGAWALGPTSDLNFRADFSTGQRVSTTSLACTDSMQVDAATICTATVADNAGGTAPTGTVSFTDTLSATFTPSSCTLAGGTCTTSFRPGVLGAHALSASYAGASHLASSDGRTVTATKHPTSTAVDCTPAARPIAAPSTCTVTVSTTGGATPTGVVSFAGNESGAFTPTTCTLSAGTCSVAYLPTAVDTGTHTITGAYGGATSFSASSGTDAVAVSRRTTETTTTCTPTAPLVGEATTCTATVADIDTGTTSTPGGIVGFTHTGDGDLSAPSCTLSDGTCSVGYTPSAAGEHEVTASFDGDALHAASTASATISVAAVAVPTPPPAPAPAPAPVDPPASSPTVRLVSISDTTRAGAPVGDRPGRVGIDCKVDGERITRCEMTLTAIVNGKRIIIGHGTETINGSGTTKRVVVTTKLTALGRRLLNRPGGVKVRVRAKITVAGSDDPLRGSASTQLVPRGLVIAPGDGLFAPASAVISDDGKDFLQRLRAKLEQVKSIACVGFTDSQGSTRDNLALGQERADAVCAFLVRNREIASSSTSRGEGDPRASNMLAAGRAQNRRVEIHLGY